MTHTSLSHWGMHDIDPAAEYCRTELTQPLPERASDPFEIVREARLLARIAEQDRLIAKCEEALKEYATDETPEGWHAIEAISAIAASKEAKND